ncbi:glycoside hydrolase family 3 N-terminal domain-containing protein [uncultured Paludibaculum sp.]|uniref:glycoside hydrolase family 3 protein n=1 Tax=uncultured Paludibaculum sp. TaxID=1765020 RepID=UPI002AAB216E|nr:glycoside hydrolase family 3 N-terminal domain-containing protein [uncultured Paludibaculum sp.]
MRQIVALAGLLLMSGLEAPAAAKKKPAAKPAPPSTSGIAQRWLRSMTPAERAAQLLMIHFYGDAPNTKSRAYRQYVTAVRELRVGGLIVLNRVKNGIVQKADPYQMAAFINRMQRLAKVPLIVGGDFERGASMRMTSTTEFPHLMAYGAANDVQATFQLGKATAREARAMGVQWVFAPDADVNNNPDNPVINTRSFSENPQVVAAHVKAFIEGAKSDPHYHVLTTVKHFPGHGDTVTDTHFGLGVVTASKERMEEVELVPFRAAIAAGVDGVMSAHLHVPAFEPETLPATVSKNILTGLLREELGFQGIAVTDAMNMQGLTSQFPAGESAVRALEAGADLLLVPANAQESVRAIVAAVKSGRLTQKRVDASVLKILNAKVHVGLNRQKLVDLEKISDEIDSPEDEEIAQRVAEKALTLVKNEGGLLPLRNPAASCHYILAAGRFSTQGRDLSDQLREGLHGSKVRLLDPQLPVEEFDELAKDAAQCETVVVEAYVTASASRGHVALSGNYPGFVDKLLAVGKPLAIVAFGNPYLLRTYPSVAAYLATYTTAAPAETAVVKALKGELEVDGKLPVTIPGLAEYGFGLKLERIR